MRILHLLLLYVVTQVCLAEDEAEAPAATDEVSAASAAPDAASKHAPVPCDFRYKYLKDLYQVVGMYQPFKKFHRYALNDADFSLNVPPADEGYFEKPIGSYIDPLQSEALTVCPKLVRKKFIRDDGNSGRTDFIDSKAPTPNGWKYLSDFYCAAEKGYCEATLPLSLIKSKDGSKVVDNVWTTDNATITEYTKNPDYNSKVDRVECYLWSTSYADLPLGEEYFIRDKMLSDDCQIFGFTQPILKRNRYGRLDALADISKDYGYYTGVLGSYLMSPYSECPKLVARRLVWEYATGATFFINMTVPVNNYKVLSTIYCAEEKGYCEADQPLTLISSKTDKQNPTVVDNVWATDAAIINDTLKNPFYNSKPDKIECYIWKLRPLPSCVSIYA